MVAKHVEVRPELHFDTALDFHYRDLVDVEPDVYRCCEELSGFIWPRRNSIRAFTSIPSFEIRIWLSAVGCGSPSGHFAHSLRYREIVHAWPDTTGRLSMDSITEPERLRHKMKRSLKALWGGI